MSTDFRNVAIVSIDAKKKDDWIFKISANSYEDGVLVIAQNEFFRYVTCKYFSNSDTCREWINTMANISNEVLLSELTSKK